MIDGIFRFYIGSCVQTSLFILFVLLIQFAIRRRSNILKCYVWSLAVLRLILPLSVGGIGVEVPFQTYQNFPWNNYISDSSVTDDGAAAAAGTNAATVAESHGTGSVEASDAETGNGGTIGGESGVSYTGTGEAGTTGTGVAGTGNLDTGIADASGSASGSADSHGVGYYLSAYRFHIIWYAGVMLFATYYVIGLCRMRRKKQRYALAVPGESGLYEWQDGTGACVIGTVRPQVYIPHGITGRNREIIITHERTHIKRHDPLLKLLAYIALGFNWYNPLAWFVFYRLSMDIEKACDEQALFGADKDARTEYAMALVKSYESYMPERVSALSFGKSNIKSRVKDIGKSHKRSRLITALVIACCVVVLGVCTTLYFAKSDKADDSAVSLDASRSTDVGDVLRTLGDAQIGASLPEIVYCDESKVSWYDHYGLFIYDMENKCLTDHVSFSDTELSSNVQGENATFVYALADGQTYYMTNERNLLYSYADGSLNKLDYSSDTVFKSKLWVYESSRSVTCSFEYDAEAKSADGTYRYLNLIVEKDGDRNVYPVFNTDKNTDEPYEIDTYDVTSPEQADENYENGEPVNLVKYYEMSDGTWRTDNYSYNYRLEISGRMNGASEDSTFIFLSNVENITFDQAWKASGLSSNMDDYFDEKDAVLVAMKFGSASASVSPSKDEVLSARADALAGMTDEQIANLTENIKVANQTMEYAYLDENIFDRLEDKDSLYWNYFDHTGTIQVGWEHDKGDDEIKDIMDSENLTREEFDEKYGDPVTVDNQYDADGFIALIESMKGTVKNADLQNDLQTIIDETRLAADTHEMEHANNVYKLLHDMDYFLLRYGPEDVGKYMTDLSLVGKYYGTLSCYM